LRVLVKFKDQVASRCMAEVLHVVHFAGCVEDDTVRLNHSAHRFYRAVQNHDRDVVPVFVRSIAGAGLEDREMRMKLGKIGAGTLK
jgi:hypothetical protein